MVNFAQLSTCSISSGRGPGSQPFSRDRWQGSSSCEEEKPIEEEPFRVKGISYMGGISSVTIGKEVYGIDDPVCGGRIIDITKNAVTISFGGWQKVYRVGSVIKYRNLPQRPG